MREIAQRDLRNDSAAVLRAVERGERIAVTRRGVPVAALVPIEDGAGLRCVRPATSTKRFAEFPRVRIDISSAELLDDLRGDR
ncbi:MAG: type II toxin-antitoxin system prevent-host-death family antitoxin [Patulibacter sp.]